MGSPARTSLSWLGRLLLVAVPLTLLCGLYYPRAISPLEPVVCRHDTSLSNAVNNPDTPFDNRVMCESDTLVFDATDRLVAVSGCIFLLAVGAYVVRNRITPRAFSAPRMSH